MLPTLLSVMLNCCFSAFSEIAKKFVKSVLTWFNKTRRFNLPASLLFYKLKIISIEILSVFQNLQVVLQ